MMQGTVLPGASDESTAPAARALPGAVEGDTPAGALPGAAEGDTPAGALLRALGVARGTAVGTVPSRGSDTKAIPREGSPPPPPAMNGVMNEGGSPPPAIWP